MRTVNVKLREKRQSRIALPKKILPQKSKIPQIQKKECNVFVLCPIAKEWASVVLIVTNCISRVLKSVTINNKQNVWMCRVQTHIIL